MMRLHEKQNDVCALLKVVIKVSEAKRAHLTVGIQPSCLQISDEAV